MSNVSGVGTSWGLPNYTGELFLIGANQTPFLNMIGGLQGGNVRTTGSFEFSLASPWALEIPSQPSVTETDSVTAPTATSYVRSQDVNTVQIFHEAVNISYAKQSVSRMATVTENGSAGYGHQDLGDAQPVQNERDFQILANMRQIAVDAEYSFLNGTYVQSTGVGVAAQMGGIIPACTSNTVAGSATLTKAMFNELLREMAGNGAEFRNPVIFVNAFQKQRLSEIFGYAPENRNIGGVNVNQIETDFAKLGVVWAPRVPAATLLIADLAVCSPVFLPVKDKGVLFYEELSKVGAAEQGQIYGQIGIDYGPEEFHGTITSLSTS